MGIWKQATLTFTQNTFFLKRIEIIFEILKHKHVFLYILGKYIINGMVDYQ